MKLIQNSEVERDLVVEVKGDSVMIAVVDPDVLEACDIVFELKENGSYAMRNADGSILEGYLVIRDEQIGFE